MKPKELIMDEKLIVGIGVRTMNKNEINPEKAQLQKLWNKFYQEKIMEKVQGRSQSPYIYGVYYSYESDLNGQYSVLAGFEVDKQDRSNGTYSSVRLKKGRYLVFEAKGEIPRVVIETWKSIWKYFLSHEAPTRAYATDYEVYKGPDELAIYIGVE